MKFLLIGVTGKMGVGKSLFSSFLKKKGIPVYSSDERGKILMNQTEIIKKNIIKHFGNNSYKEKKINKTYLSNIVFQNPNALKLLCSIVHPWISVDFKKWIFSIRGKFFYLIKESALLFESKSYKECDHVITITSPVEEMISRVIKRDNLNEYQIVNRLKNQMSNKKRKEKSSLFIENNSSVNYLKKKSDEIHNLFIDLYKNQDIQKKYGKRR
ncbi:dephospho-CoA kinase [Blattabacterium cuenoti]|uniref:dephospho-CoA kinase n=1 Tax=Blattabacterium cuenoti TaxID=1653831 RepID=UPI00163C8F75|nr:dephospho-CoA kinase [Blattabacterium cuenoti]